MSAAALVLVGLVVGIVIGKATSSGRTSGAGQAGEQTGSQLALENVPVEDETPTVVLDANGGECDSTTWDVAYGKEYGADLPHPTRFGYDFDGWYTEADGGEKVGGSTTVTVGRDHTLYARWIPKPEMYLAELTQYEWTGDQDAWGEIVKPGDEVRDNHDAVHSYGFVGQSYDVDLLDPNTVTYDIDKGYAKLTGSWGLRDKCGDATIRDGKTLWLEIYGDGALIYAAPEVESGSSLKPIEIDVSNVQYLRFNLGTGISPSSAIDHCTAYGLFDPILHR